MSRSGTASGTASGTVPVAATLRSPPQLRVEVLAGLVVALALIPGRCPTAP